jgi:hypothetical protein
MKLEEEQIKMFSEVSSEREGVRGGREREKDDERDRAR